MVTDQLTIEQLRDENARLKSLVVEIRTQRDELEDDSCMLNALEQAGVDNWEGYCEAINICNEMMGE